MFPALVSQHLYFHAKETSPVRVLGALCFMVHRVRVRNSNHHG